MDQQNKQTKTHLQLRNLFSRGRYSQILVTDVLVKYTLWSIINKTLLFSINLIEIVHLSELINDQWYFSFFFYSVQISVKFKKVKPISNNSFGCQSNFTVYSRQPLWIISSGHPSHFGSLLSICCGRYGTRYKC